MWDFPAARLRKRPDALQRRAPGDLGPSEVQLEDRRDAAGSFSHAERWVTKRRKQVRRSRCSGSNSTPFEREEEEERCVLLLLCNLNMMSVQTEAAPQLFLQSIIQFIIILLLFSILFTLFSLTKVSINGFNRQKKSEMREEIQL